MTQQQIQQLLKNPDNMTPLEQAEIGRMKQAYFSAVATETAAYIEAKETYEEAKEFMDINDPGEREVIMQLLKNVRDGEANMVTIANELENHFGISG